MTTTLQILAAIALSMMIYGIVKAEISLRKEKSRLKRKRELRGKLQRKLDRATELNLAIIDEAMKGNQEAADSLMEVSRQESEEIEVMMKEYDGI